MADIFEVIMLICFGLSWPINIRKAWIGRTAKGTSVVFYFFILIGYIAGLISKAIKMNAGISTPWYVWFFYVLNSLMVTCGILIWFRNKRFDTHQGK